MKSITSIILLGFLFACGQPQKVENHNNDSITESNHPAEVSPAQMAQPAADSILQKMPVNTNEKANVEVKTFQNNEGGAMGTWGYDILMDNKPYIHQPSMPAMSGMKGFSSEAKAHKAGEFVAYKIKHNMMPPSVTPRELDSLRVLK